MLVNTFLSITKNELAQCTTSHQQAVLKSEKKIFRTSMPDKRDPGCNGRQGNPIQAGVGYYQKGCKFFLSRENGDVRDLSLNLDLRIFW